MSTYAAASSPIKTSPRTIFAHCRNMAGETYRQSSHGDDGTEWRVDHENVEALRPAWLFSCTAALRDKVVGFAKTAWKTGADDPRKVLHGLKMAIALTICSVFYYVRPLYVFTGENAIWAILTVVLIIEYTVGGCVYKGLNRAMATVVGGAMALGVQWVAVAPMALQRLITVSIGAIICFAVCALIFPVWAGQELHAQVVRDMEKLAAAVEGCVEDYFSEAIGAGAGAGERAARRALSAKSQGYRAVLNAKASEDSMANLARWEPAHGKFGFRHPYPLYQKVGAAMRCCAYCVDALAAGVASEAQAPPHVKKHLAGACSALARHCAAVLREASGSVASMTRSGRLALIVGDMNAAAQELRDELRCLAAALEEDESSDTEHEQSNATVPPAMPLIEALPLFTAASLLLEICTRAEGVVGAVNALATTAKFKKADDHEGNTLDVEACVPVAMSTTLTADEPQETHANVAGDKEKSETAADHVTENAPRDQVS
ncbi:hypothetical protein ACP70R_043103 [Stipagrostis hirtigluma subsp. patula]